MKTFRAPLTSKIVRLECAGLLDPVTAGQTIAILKPQKNGETEIPKELQFEVPVTSPISGRIYIRPQVQAGSLVEQGEDLFFLLSEQEAWALKKELGGEKQTPNA